MFQAKKMGSTVQNKVVFEPETYSEPFYTSKIELSARPVNGRKLLTIFAKSSNLGV